MPNQLKTNPYHVDTFAADVEFAPAGQNVQVNSVVFTSATAGDRCVLVDGRGNIAYVSRIHSANATDEQSPGVSFNGLTLDVSQGQFTGPANLLIYSK